MKVLKFGGTSVGNPQRIKNLSNIINNSEPSIVVLSAMAETTNTLVAIADSLYDGNIARANECIKNLEKIYLKRVVELFETSAYLKKGEELIASHFNYIRNFIHRNFTAKQERAILAQGELISSALLHYHLEEIGVESVLLPALSFMRVDKDKEPDYFYIKENLERLLNQYPENRLFITQGFICRNAYGEIDNLERGGSDYTASLIGAVLKVEEVQIWTDIDGFHNNDPRYVPNTYPLKYLSFDEAAELAYFGAKIMHPASIVPCKNADVAVRLKNTMNPSDVGTLVSNKQTNQRIKAVAAKDGICAIKIKSGRMLLAYGFLRKIFEIFEMYKTPIDMITTSEVAVSITIDNSQYIESIKKELSKYGEVEIDTEQSIVCIVGDFVSETAGIVNKVLSALETIPLRMISYGGSEHNVSVLVNTDDKVDALKALSEKLF